MPETVESETRIQASRDDVWNVLSDVGGIHKWAAPVAEARLDGEPGEGARRHCTFADGTAIDEEFTAWKDGELQRYEITGDMPTESLTSEWRLEEADGETIVTYRAEFEPTEGTPAEAVAEELGGTGQFLVNALKTYVETGEVLEPPENEDA